MVHSTIYKKRHDTIIKRVKNAAGTRWSVMGESEKMGSEDRRPDLVLKKDKDVLILDATVPFDNGLEALAKGRRKKVEK